MDDLRVKELLPGGLLYSIVTLLYHFRILVAKPRPRTGAFFAFKQSGVVRAAPGSCGADRDVAIGVVA